MPHRQHLERLRARLAARAERLLGEQVRGAGLFERAAPRARGNARRRHRRPSRRRRDGDRAQRRAPAGVAAAEIAERRAASEKMLRMAPARAGEIIVRAVERRRARVLVGGDAVFVAWSSGWRRCATGAFSPPCSGADGAAVERAGLRRPLAVGRAPRLLAVQRTDPLTRRCAGHSQNGPASLRPEVLALCSIASTGARSRSP